MRAVVIVLVSPILSDLLSFLYVDKHIAVKALCPELTDEAFDVRVLPGAARRDVDGLALTLSQPSWNTCQRAAL